MPLSLQHSWSETETHVLVKVKRPEACEQSPDVFATDAFIKVNAPPYLFAADLHGDICEPESHAKISKGLVKFELKKQTPGLWGALLSSQPKDEKKARREASLAAWEARQKEVIETMDKQRRKLDDVAFQKHWDIEKAERAEIERQQEQELLEESKQLFDWAELDAVDQPSAECAEPATVPQIEAAHSDEPLSREDERLSNSSSEFSLSGTAQAQKSITPSDDSLASSGAHDQPCSEPSAPPVKQNESVPATDMLKEKHAAVSRKRDPKKEIWTDVEIEAASKLPPPRSHSATSVSISFTPMPSHLPLRTAPEEDDITALKKTQRSNHADAVDVGEQNASWLKDRGDYFFKTTNYKAAINAYTAALQIDAEHISCFSNRAACHLALEDYARCIDDSEQALALLSVKESTPACRWSSNATRALVRKGTAQLRLGMFDLAVQTLQQAIEIVAESDQLHADISGLLKLVETDQVSTLKKRADDLFMALDVEQAVALYEEAISIDAGCFQLHSNLAACRLKLDDYTACVESCNQAISCLLPRNESVFSDDVTRPKLPKLLIKPLTRRGSAHAWLHQYEKAYEDYRVALSLDPSNSQLQNDTNTLKDIVMQYIRAEAAMMAESNLKPAPER